MAGRFTMDWVTAPIPNDVAIDAGLSALRARAREKHRNNGHIKAYVRACHTNIVGHRGVILQSRVTDRGGLKPDRLARQAIEAGWKDWGRKGGPVDKAERRSWRQFQVDVITSCCTDGEFFAIIDGDRGHPVRLTTVDPETIPVSYSEDLGNGRYIRQGIEFYDNGRVRGYWMSLADPKKSRHGYAAAYGNGTADLKFVPAKSMIHVYLPEFAIQNRGVPWVAPGLLALGMLHGYHEAELIAARIAASQMGWITEAASGDTYEGDDPDADDTDDGLDEIISDPGTYRRLPYGVDVKPPDTSRPNSAFEGFVKANVRGLAAAWGAGYAEISGDYSDANYSALRAAALVEQESWKLLQEWLIESFHEPIFRQWVELSIDMGYLTIAGAQPAGPLTDYLAHGWQPRRWAWVDPQKEMAAQEKALANGLKSRSEIIRDMGRDPDDVWQEIHDENAILESLGIVLQPVQSTESAPEPAPNDEE
ncbi:phage portal protein [Marinihelvus fidelis]|nr:phage portal protein [Marinihelvus fidelis]